MTALSKRLWDIKYSTYKICNKIFTEFHKIIQMSVLKKKSKKDVGGVIKPASCKTCCWYHGRELHFPFHFQDGMCSESQSAIGQMSPWNKECSWQKWEQLPREKKKKKLHKDSPGSIVLEECWSNLYALTCYQKNMKSEKEESLKACGNVTSELTLSNPPPSAKLSISIWD